MSGFIMACRLVGAVDLAVLMGREVTEVGWGLVHGAPLAAVGMLGGMFFVMHEGREALILAGRAAMRWWWRRGWAFG